MESLRQLSDLPKNNISISFYEGPCNLQCPKCHVHGKNRGSRNLITGSMGLEKACILFDELKGSDTVVNAGGYVEPFMQKDYYRYLMVAKKRDIKININTNGLLMTERWAWRLINLKIDSFFVSVDAVTKNTLKKIKSTDKLKQIHEAIFTMLKMRGDKTYPRIGVSFVVEKDNVYEKDEFVAFWIKHVDVVRIAKLNQLGNDINHKLIPKDRKPCASLYETMLIHHNGDVPICCLDGTGRTKVGNVFKDGIKGVWLGKEFQKIRHYHESGQFDKVPFCKECGDWSRNHFTKEEVKDGILMRRSPLLTYYNRIDRLGNWGFGAGKHIKI